MNTHRSPQHSLIPQSPVGVSELLRTARIEAGLSVQQLATKAGVARTTIIHLEYPKSHIPSDKRFIPVATALAEHFLAHNSHALNRAKENLVSWLDNEFSAKAKEARKENVMLNIHEVAGPILSAMRAREISNAKLLEMIGGQHGPTEHKQLGRIVNAAKLQSVKVDFSPVQASFVKRVVEALTGRQDIDIEQWARDQNLTLRYIEKSTRHR
jgi:transcriptional regulator with XRE-family HTH domain